MFQLRDMTMVMNTQSGTIPVHMTKQMKHWLQKELGSKTSTFTMKIWIRNT